MRKALLILLMVSLGAAAFAQKAAKDSAVIKDPLYTEPFKAGLMSAILPGLGQAYNKKYWKIPVLYAGAATMGYFIGFNNSEYKIFRNAYVLRVEGDKTSASMYDKYPSADQLSAGRDYFRRNRDLLIILTVALYALNIVDASVDAHLKSFNTYDDLSRLSIKPQLIEITNLGTGHTAPVYGFNAAIKF